MTSAGLQVHKVPRTRHCDSVDLLLRGNDTAFAIVNRARAVGEVDHSSSWVRRVRREEEGEEVLIEAHEIVDAGW